MMIKKGDSQLKRGQVESNPKLQANLSPKKVTVTFFVAAMLAGTAHAELNVNPIGSVTMAYDDNITQAHTNEKDDFVTTLKAGLNLNYEQSTQSLSVTGDVRQQLYAQEDGFNNLAQDLAVDFKQELSKYDRLQITDTFRHAEDPGSFDDEFGRTSGRYSYYRNIFDLQYSRDLSKQFAMLAYYGNQSYDASLATVSDSTLNRGGIDLTYLPSSTAVLLLGYDFTARSLDPGGTAKTNTIAAGLLYYFSPRLYIDTRAGVTMVEAFNGDDAAEPSVVVTLTNELSETERLSLSYSNTSIPGADTADIFDAWRVSLSYASQLLERLRFSIALFYGEGEYDVLNITDEQTGVSPRLTYDIQQDIQAFLGYTYSQVESTITTREYERNLIQIGMNIKF